MPPGRFTYEVRTVDKEAVGVEDYVVRTSDGDAVGTVGELLDRMGERLLVVEAGAPPLARQRRALPWSAVQDVDHEALAVWLRLEREAYESEAIELDPADAVDEADGAAEAHRIAETPEDLIPAPHRQGGGPVDRSGWVRTLAAFALFSFATLFAVLAVFLGGSGWAFVFVVPGVLATVLAVLAYHAYRRPYEPRGARKP